ncbi:zinc finger protein 37-like isoform X3 [Mugil cephalus]|uniref:zinc finger protein 37-like isoform X3 n=1 Tax=Mugil cephalus TaxID=48193 RepID=UPI001FB6A232|nr:zinc finger protein 37-like isoform X3 [Mugil cephalus]
MNQVDYLHQLDTGSLTLEEKLEIKGLGVHQPQDVGRNQTTDVQQLLAIKEEVPPDLDQQDPELLHIKEEQEELLTSHEERFPFAVVQVKSEGDEEKPPLSQLQLRQTEDEKETESPTSSSAPQMKTEADGEEPARNPNPNSTNKKSSDSSETEVADDEGDGWLSPSSDYKLENGDDEEEELSTDTADEEDYYRHHSNVEIKNLSVHQAQDVSIKHISDVQQLSVIKEEVPSNLSPSLEQQGPGPVHIKEEQEEVLSSQEQEQLHVLEEADVTRFKDSAVKSESDQDKPPSSQLNQSQTGDTAETETPTNIWTERMKSERGGEDVGAREPARNSNPNTHFQPHADETSTETEGGDKACMRLHRRKKTLVCDICGQSFTQGVNLNSHMRGHTGEKPYSCNVCEKTFARDCNLSRHMIVHTREKPFACHVCDLRFKHRASLKMHMRVHTGVKPFACVVCGGRFNRSGTLKIHMRLHTGEKPFACDVCGHSYTVKSNLTKHMRVHSQQRPCGCCICGKTFNREAHLKTHMTVHTRKTPWM